MDGVEKSKRRTISCMDSNFLTLIVFIIQTKREEEKERGQNLHERKAHDEQSPKTNQKTQRK